MKNIIGKNYYYKTIQCIPIIYTNEKMDTHLFVFRALMCPSLCSFYCIKACRLSMIFYRNLSCKLQTRFILYIKKIGLISLLPSIFCQLFDSNPMNVAIKSLNERFANHYGPTRFE